AALECVAVLDADHVEVIDGPRPSRFEGQSDFSDSGAQRSKELAVAPGHFATFCVPLPQALELDGQDPCLDRVESAIVPLDVVDVFPRLAMISQHLAVPRQSLVVGGDGSRLSAGAPSL